MGPPEPARCAGAGDQDDGLARAVLVVAQCDAVDGSEGHEPFLCSVAEADPAWCRARRFEPHPSGCRVFL
ncbi:hypothetical protein GCM10023085_56300 [Actinomadura viridis]